MVHPHLCCRNIRQLKIDEGCGCRIRISHNPLGIGWWNHLHCRCHYLIPKSVNRYFSVFPDVLSFALKIVSFVMSIATISLFLCWYSPIFKWIGMPMIPYLQLCQMPDAAVIATATLVGCAEIALPVMTIAGQQISEMAIFFVIVLSTVQIIFFTESANAMMKADMGLKFGQLIVIFLIRTVIAIPIVSLFAHIIYG